MEIEYAFRASSAAQRREAIVAYMEGEKLCDEGDLSSGMKMLKRASFLAWELSLEEWPSWANALRAELSGGTASCDGDHGVTGSPVLIGADNVRKWQRESIVFHKGIAASAASSIAMALAARNVAIVDNLCDSALVEEAREQCGLEAVDG